MSDAEVVERLREIVRIASELAALDGDHLALGRRAIEIAANAETMLWSVAPDDSDWLDRLGARVAASAPDGDARDARHA